MNHLYQEDLEVGKTYRLVSGKFVDGLLKLNETFTVTDIDPDGDVWTRDCTWRGDCRRDRQGWCFTDTGIDLVFEEVI